jgi:hypothetical protein
MADRPIKRNIEDYLTLAKQLEAHRTMISDSLDKSLIEDIIPSVEKHLPRGYQIDHQQSEIYYNSPCLVGVPTEIVVSLRLNYNDQAIVSWHDEGKILIDKARKALEPILKELSDSYGVEVVVDGEPVHIG